MIIAQGYPLGARFVRRGGRVGSTIPVIAWKLHDDGEPEYMILGSGRMVSLKEVSAGSPDTWEVVRL